MKIGLLWFDNSKNPLSVKIEGAVSYYEKKFGRKPTVAVVNPTTSIDEKCNLIIETSHSIMPNHIWVGMEE